MTTRNCPARPRMATPMTDGFTRTQRVVLATLLLGALVGWFAINPAAAFGTCRYGLTTYNRFPVPVVDLQVRSDGTSRWVRKRHVLDDAILAWPLSQPATVLIIGTGWDGGVRPPLLNLPPTTELRILPNADALRLFNTLRARGTLVAIHLHSTC